MKVLIVEDEKKIASFLKNGLKQERYLVETATDGNEALEMAMNNHYDAILLDIMLPGLNGLEVLKTIRANNISTPVIIVSALGATDERVFGLDAGADDYIAKPFSFDELTARLRAVLRRSSKNKSTKIKAGEVTLDTVTHLAYRDNKEIELTTKEYALLEYMMRNKNKILSRNSITQNVWKSDYDPDSNVIDVYIKKIRSKIEKPGTRPSIQSVRGVGYRLRDDSGLEEMEKV